MGPGVGLLLFEKRAMPDIRAELLPWLETFCHGVTVASDGGVDFWIDHPSAIEAGHVDARGTCMFSLGEEWYWYEEEFRQLPRQPVQRLTLAAGCKQHEDHLLLGHFALTLARHFEALIDFDGDLGGNWLRDLPNPSPQQQAALRDWEQWPLSSLPGNLWEIPTHVGDTEFLAAWLRHPQFYLVK